MSNDSSVVEPLCDFSDRVVPEAILKTEDQISGMGVRFCYTIPVCNESGFKGLLRRLRPINEEQEVELHGRINEIEAFANKDLLNRYFGECKKGSQEEDAYKGMQQISLSLERMGCGYAIEILSRTACLRQEHDHDLEEKDINSIKAEVRLKLSGIVEKCGNVLGRYGMKIDTGTLLDSEKRDQLMQQIVACKIERDPAPSPTSLPKLKLK